MRRANQVFDGYVFDGRVGLMADMCLMGRRGKMIKEQAAMTYDAM